MEGRGPLEEVEARGPEEPEGFVVVPVVVRLIAICKKQKKKNF